MIMTMPTQQLTCFQCLCDWLLFPTLPRKLYNLCPVVSCTLLKLNVGCIKTSKKQNIFPIVRSVPVYRKQFHVPLLVFSALPEKTNNTKICIKQRELCFPFLIVATWNALQIKLLKMTAAKSRIAYAAARECIISDAPLFSCHVNSGLFNHTRCWYYTVSWIITWLALGLPSGTMY